MTTAHHDMLPTAHLGRRRSVLARTIRENVIMAGLVFCGLFSVLTTGTIIVVLAKESIAFFGLDEVSFAELAFGTEWNPLLGAEKHFGVWPLISGTLLVTGVAMAVAMPLGLISAIYLSEYAPSNVRAVIKPVLEVLAGIPTVVFGFFALTVITPALQ
jgi:phosphate transport system permease protein